MRSPRLFLAFVFALTILSLAPIVWPLASSVTPSVAGIDAQSFSILGREIAERVAKRVGHGHPVHRMTSLDSVLPDDALEGGDQVIVRLDALADPGLMRTLERPLTILPTPIASSDGPYQPLPEAEGLVLDALLTELTTDPSPERSPTIVDGHAVTRSGGIIYAALISGPAGQTQALVTVHRASSVPKADWRLTLGVGAAAAAAALTIIGIALTRAGADDRAMIDFSRAFDAPGGTTAHGLADPSPDDDTAVTQIRRALRQVVMANAAFEMLEEYLDRKGHPTSADADEGLSS